MSLENLVGISLEKIEPHVATIKRLLSSAARNIEDARIPQVATENRFDIAYKAIMQLANAALLANGYRTLTSRPGHHATMIQSLAKSVGLDPTAVKVLDAMRKQRNVVDYSGDLVPESAAKECIGRAEELLQTVTTWLANNRPDMLS